MLFGAVAVALHTQLTVRDRLGVHDLLSLCVPLSGVADALTVSLTSLEFEPVQDPVRGVRVLLLLLVTVLVVLCSTEFDCVSVPQVVGRQRLLRSPDAEH